MNLPDILSLCKLNKKFNKTVCQSDNFWYRKLQRDYNFTPKESKNSKEKYEILRDIIYKIQESDWDESDWDEGMYWAAKRGHKDIIEYFIEKGADNWNLGLGGAAEGGYIFLMEYFLDRGADPSIYY